MQFLCELSMIFLKICMCMGESYTSYIKRVLSCDFQITLKNRNIDGGGGECNYSLTILKEICLLLQLPINFSHTACMVPLSIVIVATYLKFFSNRPF